MVRENDMADLYQNESSDKNPMKTPVNKLEDLRDFQTYTAKIDKFVESENKKTEPELVVDNYGASLLEVQNNAKYRHVKKAIKQEEKLSINIEELERMMRNERASIDYGAQMPKQRLRLNIQDHIEKEDFPNLTNVEFWLLLTQTVNTYISVIDNNLNKKVKIT